MSAAEKLRIATAKECGGMRGHDLIICTEDGSSVGVMSPGYPGEAHAVSAARAARLVACWNACVGISTESLARIKFDPPSFNKAAIETHKEMLDALVLAERYMAGHTHVTDSWPYNGLLQIRAVIAKTKAQT